MSDPVARATALYQEGRYVEAERELASVPDDTTARALVALCRSARGDTGTRETPADAVFHADQGWELLRAGDPRAALDRFREALRLDPSLEFARTGAAEAVGARYLPRRAALAALRRLARLKPYWWVVLLGNLVASRAAEAVAARYPGFGPAVDPLAFVGIALLGLVWTAALLSDAVLRLSRFGRLALSPARRVAAAWAVGCAAGALAWIAFGLLAPAGYAFLWRRPALACGALLFPVSYLVACRPGWPRRAIIGYAGLATAGAVIGSALFVAVFVLVEQGQPAASYYRAGRTVLSAVFGAGPVSVVLSLWLTSVQPRK